MTLPLNSRLSALYDTNGTQKDFGFGFRVFFDPDNGGYGLEVRRQTADGYEVIPKSDYLVLPVEDNSAGIVRFSVAPSAGQQIYIAGKTPTIQQLVLTNFGRYSAESIETQFDFITAIIQEWLSALGEETRQRIAADDILTQYVVQRIDDFVQQVNQNWDDKSQEIEDYIATIMPSFTQALRDEIEAYAVAGMQDAINQTLAESKSEIDDAVARANAAALAAAITGKVYDTPEAGVDPVTGVQNGAYYNVRSTDDDSFLVEYQNIGGVPTPSGKSYPSFGYVQEIAEYTTMPFVVGKTYGLNARIQLDNGAIVKSTIPENTVNPNENMTGWVNTGDTSQIFDSESGLDQKVLNSIFKSKKYMDVRYFGIYPGLSNDIGVLINTADAAARSLGCGLYFPVGTYLATGLLPTVSWTGDGKGKTIIKNHGTNVNTGFCAIKNNMVFKIYDGITFDGSVSADPVAWNSTNYDSFTGSIPLFIENSSKVILSNIECKNAAKMSNLRITASYDVFLFDVDTEKARGNFGDGIYIAVNSRRIFGDRVNIKDVTRIGLVFEGGARDCVFNNITVDYAHDCSRQYGGGEYNGGVWAENATGIYINDSSTNNTRDYGFLCTTGAMLTGYAKAHFELRNCTADNVSVGFMNRSKQDSIPASHKLFNCKSNAYTPFMFAARYDDDSYESYNCDATIKGSTTTMSPIYAALYLGYDKVYSGKRNKVNIKDFAIKREVPLTKFTDTEIYDADITIYTGHYFDIKLDNVHTLDDSPVYIKNRLIVATNDKTVIANSKVYFPTFRTTDLKTHACELSGSINNSTGKSRFNNTEIKTKLSLTSYDFRFNDLDCDFALAADFLEILSTNDTLDLVGKINNAKFKKDISAGDYSLKYQSGNNANKAKLLVSNSEFYSSSGATTAANSHFWVVRNPSSVIYQNVLRDDFAPMQKVASTITSVEPIGVTAITLH